MKILVINGDCLQINSSANLCHLAYIRGFISAGHDVELLSADAYGYKIDSALKVPDRVISKTIRGMSLYEKLSIRKKNRYSTGSTFTNSGDVTNDSLGLSARAIRSIKSFVLSFYGVHGINATFVRKAKKFKTESIYDYIISISTPPASHLLARNLIKSGHIKGIHWIQIWEDPWYSDAYGFNHKKKIFNEERRLLSFADKVCYVSPLTLRNQQKLFPESACKMFWKPLPSYYKDESIIKYSSDCKVYGYFGDYFPTVRDLTPFYTAATETGVEVNICGRPYDLLQNTESIHIHPRLPLAELKPIEDKTNVLVFLCNRGGGQIPGKIYQYSVTSKTILFILDGTEDEKAVLQEYFAKFNRYVFCQNRHDDIVRAIKQIESGNTGDVKDLPIDDFEPEKIVSDILEAGK